LHPVVHIVWPDGQAAQSVPAVLQPLGQLLVVATQFWFELHVAVDVTIPAVHDCAGPHTVPTGRLAYSTHWEVPVEQEVRASRQGLGGVHATPAVQETQLPALQTWFVPQLLPSASSVPVSVHTDVPVLQVSVPTWQGLVGVHAPPAVQATQVPALQTWFVPQAVPLERFPVSAQTDVPVMHDVAPIRQGLVGWQLAPAVQATQVPALQTRLVPQTVPLARFEALSVQVMVGEQEVTPVWQGLAGAQARPAVHETHAPPLHTMLVPQLMPFCALPDSMQTGAPVLQVVVPVRQGRPAMLQLAPAVQSPQAPAALQTRLVPQAVPAGRFVPASMHCGVPVEQDSVPWWQGLLGVHAAPAWQAPHWPAWQTMPAPQVVPFG
jgi:hypothetical protein